MYLGRHTCLPFLFDEIGLFDDNRGAAVPVPAIALLAVPLLAELGRLPPSILLVGDRRRVVRVLAHLEDPVDVSARCRAELGAHAAGRVAVGCGHRRGVPVLVVETQMGGPATEIITREVLDESFHPTPPTAVVRVGSCGVFGSLEPPPELVVAAFATGWSGALQQAEGGVLTAFGGAEPPVVPCTPAMIEALDDGVAKAPADLPAATGGVLSKDSLYAEEGGRLTDAMRRLGCIATEKGLAWGGIMASAGWIPKGEWFGRERAERNEDAAIDAALEAVCLLAAR